MKVLTIDYTFYKDVYGGTSITEDAFNRVINRALGVLNECLSVDVFTYDFDSDPEAQVTRLKFALCNTADAVNSLIDTNTGLPNPVVSSESIAGTWSRSYAVSTTANTNSYRLSSEVQATVNMWLSGTPYIYGALRMCI